METLDPRLFFNLIHAFIRGNHSVDEAERAARVMKWLEDNLGNISRVCEGAQRNLVGIIYDQWAQHRSAPSFAIVEGEVLKKDKPDGMLFILTEYEATRAKFPLFDELDMPALLENRKQDWERGMMHDVLQTAMNINHGRMGGKKEKDKPLSGGRDAVAYILDCLQQGALVEDQRAVGGSLSEDSGRVEDSYQRAEEEARDGKMIIPTGLRNIDDVTGGVRRRALTGVLGYAGQRKSAICRTIAYRAAEAGFRGLHIPLESSAEEELSIYAVMHSHHPKFTSHRQNISYQNFDSTRLTLSQKVFLFDIVLPDLKENLLGDIVVRQPMDRTWTAIKSLIERENRISPLDFVFIDYLTLVTTSGSNATDVMNDIIRDAKAHCMKLGGDRGYALISPVQGNRGGHDKAAANGGAWLKDGVGQYNEFEKSADLLLYVFQDLELQAANQLKIGTCKSRRSADAPVGVYEVDQHSGIVRDVVGQNILAEALRRDIRSILAEGDFGSLDRCVFSNKGYSWTS